MIKRAQLLILLISLSGCSTVSDLATGYTEIFGNIKNFAFKESLDISQEEIDSFPYSFAMARFGRASFSRIVLASYQNGVFEWVSADGTSLYTLDGKIIKTIGLSNDVHIAGYIPGCKSQDYIVNFIEPKLFNINLESKFTIDNDICEEVVSYIDINWKTNNQYIYQDKRVTYSNQRIHPFLPELEIYFYIK